VKEVFDEEIRLLSGVRIEDLKPGEASGVIRALINIDEILRVIF
jgi:hypothetical protein